MKRALLIVILIAGWCLAGCGPSFVRPLPKIAPIEDSTEWGNNFKTTLHVSTNCAEIGEVITITLTIENRSSSPITLTNTPLIDIVLEPQRAITNPADVQRWSDDPMYPQPVDPIIAAQSIRTHEWIWHADPRYAVTQDLGEDGIVMHGNVTILTPEWSTPVNLQTLLTAGVRSMRAGTESGTVLCKNLTK